MGKWIPVGERLPEGIDRERPVVSVHYEDGDDVGEMLARYDSWDGHGGYFEDFGGWRRIEGVTHWQPYTPPTWP